MVFLLFWEEGVGTCGLQMVGFFHVLRSFWVPETQSEDSQFRIDSETVGPASISFCYCADGHRQASHHIADRPWGILSTIPGTIHVHGVRYTGGACTRTW